MHSCALGGLTFLLLITACTGLAQQDDPFTDHGVAAQATRSNGATATVDGDGRRVVLVWLCGTGHMLVIDAETGATQQIEIPGPPGGNFAVLHSSRDLWYAHLGGTATGAGGVLYEFDPRTLSFTFAGETTDRYAMSMHEDRAGVIWGALYPNAQLISFNPDTRVLTDHGFLNDETWPQYMRAGLARDEVGWVYTIIGYVRCQVVGYNPADGEVRRYIPEQDRAPGQSHVHGRLFLGTDGQVYATAPGWSWRRLYAGGRLYAYDSTQPWNPTVERVVRGIRAQDLAKVVTVAGGRSSYLADHDVVFMRGDQFGAEATFPLTVPDDGDWYLHIQPYLHEPYCTVQFLFNGEQIGEPFVASHPETKPGPVQVFGPLQLQAGEQRLGVRLLETEGREPWFGIVAVDLSRERQDTLLPETAQQNPVVLAQWRNDVTRPRTALVHPDNTHVMMAGFAGYGLVGGGIGIVNLETGEDTLLTAADHLLPGHSCITLKALADGNLVGGTSTTAPGGGHVTATEAELFILDWQTKKVLFRTAPVPGDRNIISIWVMDDGLVYGLSGNSTFFVFDPNERRVVHSESFAAAGSVPRHALQAAQDGRLYAVMRNAVLRITPGTFEHEKLADTPAPATAGGVWVDGRLYWASVSRVWSYGVPEL